MIEVRSWKLTCGEIAILVDANGHYHGQCGTKTITGPTTQGHVATRLFGLTKTEPNPDTKKEVQAELQAIMDYG